MSYNETPAPVSIRRRIFWSVMLGIAVIGLAAIAISIVAPTRVASAAEVRAEIESTPQGCRAEMREIVRDRVLRNGPQSVRMLRSLRVGACGIQGDQIRALRD